MLPLLLVIIRLFAPLFLPRPPSPPGPLSFLDPPGAHAQILKALLLGNLKALILGGFLMPKPSASCILYGWYEVQPRPDTGRQSGRLHTSAQTHTTMYVPRPQIIRHGSSDESRAHLGNKTLTLKLSVVTTAVRKCTHAERNHHSSVRGDALGAT
jgi:hypothetical protein